MKTQHTPCFLDLQLFGQSAIYLGKETNAHLIYLVEDDDTVPLTEDEFQRLIKPRL